MAMAVELPSTAGFSAGVDQKHQLTESQLPLMLVAARRWRRLRFSHIKPQVTAKRLEALGQLRLYVRLHFYCHLVKIACHRQVH